MDVVNTNSHLVAGHTSHRVFVGLQLCHTRVDIHLWIVSHHRLVHAIERQSLPVRTPKRTFLNTEFIAMDSLSIDNLA